ncbi:hypothetical protein DERF_006921 [Dermatophagoides farinae]|uniref:Secreted protein n=1 Tax=Dermatophagoides farinae TaxID=6954 RepID=A0A922L7G4_DERFA|nr:hypothetical protein DERF_006921 [Dermatophagoides farinae]
MKNKLFLFIIITIWSNGGHFGRLYTCTEQQSPSKVTHEPVLKNSNKLAIQQVVNSNSEFTELTCANDYHMYREIH